MSWRPLGADVDAWQRRGLSIWTTCWTWVRADPMLALLFTLGGGIVGMGANVVIGPRRFDATTGINVASGQGIELPSVLAGLAASSGLRLGGNTLPLAFQTEIVASDPFQDSLLVSAAPGPCTGGATCTFLDRIGPPSGPTSVRLSRARHTLGDYLDVVRDERSHIIAFGYSDPDSVLARALVARIVVLLDSANKTLTARSADDKVAFLSGQLPFLKSQLQAIEDTLEAFYTSNRSFDNSPALKFREQRLRGDYDSQLRLLQSVREQLATSELQARGGVQVIQVVIPVNVNPKPDRPLRNVALVLGMLLGGLARFSYWRVRRTV